MQGNILILLIIALLLAFSIGTQDETMVTTLSSGSLSARTAFFIGSILIVLGSLFLSKNVGQTLGISLLESDITYTDSMMQSVLITGFLLLMLGAFTTVPISLNQTIVGSIFGVVIIEAWSQQLALGRMLNELEVFFVILGWILGPLISYCVAIGIEFFLQIIVRSQNNSIWEMEKTEHFFRVFLILFVSLNQISTAGNASGNALGMVYGLNNKESIGEDMLFLMIALVAALYLIGYLTFGRRLILRLRDTMGKMRPSQTIAIEIATSLIIFIATVIGIPVSGAQILIFAMIGAAKTRGENPERGMIKRMFITWIILLPLSILLAAGIYLLFG